MSLRGHCARHDRHQVTRGEIDNRPQRYPNLACLDLQIKLLESQRPTQQLGTYRGTVPDVLKWVVVTNHSDLGPRHNITELIQSPNDRIGLAFNGSMVDQAHWGPESLWLAKASGCSTSSWSNCPKVAHGNPAGISVQNERLSNPRNA